MLSNVHFVHLTNRNGTGKMTQLVKCYLQKHENLSSHKNLDVMVHTCAGVGRDGTDPQGLLISQSNQSVSTRFSGKT